MPSIRVASDAEKRARDELSFAVWGETLTLAQYLTREERLRAHPFGAGMRTWLWCEGDEVLSSCESFAVDSTLDGAPGTTEAIATVLTAEHLRGRGHARALITAMLDCMRDEEQIHASILFSDVGERIYADVGYVVRPSTFFEWDALDGDPAEGVELVGEEDIAPLLESTGGRYVVHPSFELADWHIERERIYCEMLDEPRPSHHAARQGESSLVWTADFKNRRLEGLVLHEGDDDSARGVIESARRMAGRIGVPTLRVWAGGALPGARAERRELCLPMIVPLQESLDPQEWTDIHRVLWV